MDSWKFYNIVHRCHRVMNPVNEDRLERLYDLLELKQGARVIDVGCGKGEMPNPARREISRQRVGS